MTKRDLNYYKALNYRMNFSYEKDESRWYVEFPELPGCMADGATREEALQAALDTKDDWLETTFESGREIAEPRPEIEYSGRFLLRIPKSLHKSVAEEAKREGTSINRLAIQFLSAELERRQTLITISDEIKSTFHEIVTRPFRGIQSVFGKAVRPQVRQDMSGIIWNFASTAPKQMLVVTDKDETEDVLTDSVPGRGVST